MAHHETLTIARNRESVDAFTQLIEVTGGQVVVPQDVTGCFPGHTGTGSAQLAAAISHLDPHHTILDDCQIAIRT